MGNSGNVAPVILFTYNRPEHTKRTIEALLANDLAEQTQLFVFSDAAKRAADTVKVEEIRAYAEKVTGFAGVTLIKRSENYGLARNVIEGVTEIVNRFGRVIVLEDDLVTNRYFLRFMNDGLARYETEKKVTGITGFSHFDDDTALAGETCFHTLTGTSWSWATWKNRWEKFDEKCADWTDMVSDAGLRRRFNYDNAYDFYKIMKMQQTDARTNSWAIRWYWTNFKQGGYILAPVKSLVDNEGWDGSGEHCGDEKEVMFRHGLSTAQPITQFPDAVCEKDAVHREMKKKLKKEWQPSLLKRIYHIVLRKNYVGRA